MDRYGREEMIAMAWAKNPDVERWGGLRAKHPVIETDGTVSYVEFRVIGGIDGAAVIGAYKGLEMLCAHGVRI